MIISEILRKWFGLVAPPCLTCDVLREQLAGSERERRDLLARLLEKDKPEAPPKEEEDARPIKTTNYVPWHIRQQMLEAEDKKKAQLIKDREKEIAALEKELDIPTDAEQEERIG